MTLRRSASWTTTLASDWTPRSHWTSTTRGRNTRRSAGVGPRTWCGSLASFQTPPSRYYYCCCCCCCCCFYCCCCCCFYCCCYYYYYFISVIMRSTLDSDVGIMLTRDKPLTLTWLDKCIIIVLVGDIWCSGLTSPNQDWFGWIHYANEGCSWIGHLLNWVIIVLSENSMKI